ncbi:chemotaxis protein CheW [Salinispira pacifica]|uniref:Positive regulator of CheA protein activity (CheW) n=1 Tax=Salinispira pacifica TaxID=1307761 RepID=V5WI92_9SPIO|nr:chemotaxis protein CheW [Salinispira pacifica]AHC15279.1 Positive regulator of CheA protein activity (CheW) [Salinispira pacifica]
MKILSKSKKSAHARAAEDQDAKVENIDYKMVTFTLGGKDYGIDIMKVKEIAKFINFTYVPNTPPFVRGVYNLRGEIISIIDLREMFNLPHEDDENLDEENGLILRLESNMIGVVVDKIDKVVGISKETIQPPHPIFGDINIKYISGVVENDGRLYIILDVERILGKPEEEKDKDQQDELQRQVRRQNYSQEQSSESRSTQQSSQKKKGSQQSGETTASSPGKKPVKSEDSESVNKQFIIETLETFEHFFVSDINRDWFEQRFQEWKNERSKDNLQLSNKSDANQFLTGFSSRYTSRLWEKDLFDALYTALPDDVDNQLHIWNPGCGKGYETYSLAVLLKTKYPAARLKIWASDKDLLSVSSAPNMIFDEKAVPDIYREHMVSGPNGLSFNQEIKDAILFEYHDIAHAHAMPPIQLLVARDLLSYLSREDSSRLLNELDERMKAGGIVILGDHERIPSAYPWEEQADKELRFYRKKSS